MRNRICILLVCFQMIGVLSSTAGLSTRTGNLVLRTFPQEAELYAENGKVLHPEGRREEWRIYTLPRGFQVLELRAPGYYSKRLHLVLTDSFEVEEKLERKDSRLLLVGETPTGTWPKGVLFSPEVDYLAVTLLGGKGIDRIPFPELTPRKEIDLSSSKTKSSGYVEPYVFRQRGELWISQMETGEVHILDVHTLEVLGRVDVQGKWPKVICGSSDETYAFISNWLSQTVTVIDTKTRKVVKVIPVSGIPRGLAVTKTGTLYVCLYEPGDIEVIDGNTFTRLKTLPFKPGAKRHIVLDEKKRIGYVSDMATGRVISFSLETGKPLQSLRVGSNVNTLTLTSDGRFLFVSNRGRNNPVDYQKRGPEFGKISVIDTRTFQIVDWVWGRNQPTGLTLSPDNRYMAFTDFLDNNLEVYDISGLYSEDTVPNR